jgi:hypothetical protein
MSEPCRPEALEKPSVVSMTMSRCPSPVHVGAAPGDGNFDTPVRLDGR